MDLFTLLALLIGGFLAGVVNTLAGNGSAITLSILTEVVGLGGNLANGTNRIGIAAQSVTSSYAFYRHGRLDVKSRWPYLLPMVIGAVVGILVATKVSNDQFREVFRFLMALMLIVILVKPKRWLRETDVDRPANPWLMLPLMLVLGFYGGFIQMGMGVFFLAIMVLIGRFSLTDSNAMKIVIVGLYTFIALFIFHAQGLVDWKFGSLLAIGQATGGWFAATFAARSPQANKWAHRLLVLVVLLATLNLFFGEYLFGVRE